MTTAIVDRKELKKALQIVNRAVPKRTTLPAIQNVRLSAENGYLEVAGTDLEHAVRIPVRRLNGKGNGVALLPGRALAAHVTKAKGDTLAFEWTDDGKHHVATVGAAKIVGIAPADYPVLPEFEAGDAVKIHGGDFAAAVASVTFAVSTEIVRYALTGILLEVKGGKAHFVASDGKQLAHQTVHCTGPAGRVILSRTTADLVSRLAKRAPDADVEIRMDAKEFKVSIRVDGARVLARTIDGNFPDWRMVVPKYNTLHAEIGRDDLLDAIEQVLPCTTEQTRAARFTFRPAHVELFTRAQDVGEATAKAATVATAPTLGKVILNPEYIRDYLKALPKGVKGVETVKVYVKNGESAVRFAATHDHEYVVMPLTIDL